MPGASRAGARGDQLLFRKMLEALAAFDFRKARMVEMRFFGGLSGREADDAGCVAADGDARLARAWLRREMGEGRSRPVGAGHGGD